MSARRNGLLLVSLSLSLSLSLVSLVACKARTLGEVEELALSGSDACARTVQGSVHCWGKRFGGTAKRIEGLPHATRLVAVNDKYCVAGDDKRVTCFGFVDRQLKIAELGWSPVDRIGATDFALCGASGTTLRCRASVSLLAGQAGAASEDVSTFDEAPRSLAFAKGHIYGIGESGKMRSSKGALSATNLLPDDVASVLTHDAEGMACVRRKTGAAACVGSFGVPWGGERLEPHAARDVAELAAMDEVTGGSSFVCARKGEEVLCAGANVVGQLGDGSTVAERPSLGKVALSGGARSVLTGAPRTVGSPGGGSVSIASFGCAVMADRGVECWGDNAEEQLGDGTTTMRNKPVRVRAR